MDKSRNYINLSVRSARIILQYFALILFMVVYIAPVWAVTFETKGSPTIKSKDGNFEMVFGARAHLDAHSFDDDKANSAYPPFGSQIPNNHPDGGFNFRRGYTDVTARFHHLSFKFQNDFAAGTFPGSLREIWVAAKLGPGQLMVGQFKPYRSMEELASSNEITMMERPSTSSSGIYSGRQWMMGVGYKGLYANQLGYAANIMSLAHVGMPIAGSSYGGRLFWVPFAEEGNTLHFGFSCSVDDPGSGSLPAQVVDVYGGRRGISKSLGIAGAGAGPSGANCQTTFEVEAAYSIGPSYARNLCMTRD
ncbi:MAG: OprO/OprP family phosphate-selective porin, partial [Pseudomonadota bacterium]|nr:OprO/OprP family phosphate-selective porin [Pseudomonadota bacterium]